MIDVKKKVINTFENIIKYKSYTNDILYFTFEFTVMNSYEFAVVRLHV